MEKPVKARKVFSSPLIQFMLLPIVLGTVLLILFLLNLDPVPKEDRVPASAVVTEVRRHESGGRGFYRYRYNVHVRYTVDGQEVESRTSNSYVPGMRAGDSTQIYYDRNHPFHIQLRGVTNDTYSLLFLLLLIVVPLLAILKEILSFRASKSGKG